MFYCIISQVKETLFLATGLHRDDRSPILTSLSSLTFRWHCYDFSFVICIVFVKRTQSKMASSRFKTIQNNKRNKPDGKKIINQAKPCWTSYKERHRETVKGRGTLFLMDKPPLLLLCRGKLGGHRGRLEFSLLHLSQMQRAAWVLQFWKDQYSEKTSVTLLSQMTPSQRKKKCLGGSRFFL